jgi:hypothetical protein
MNIFEVTYSGRKKSGRGKARKMVPCGGSQRIAVDGDAETAGGVVLRANPGVFVEEFVSVLVGHVDKVVRA